MGFVEALKTSPVFSTLSAPYLERLAAVVLSGVWQVTAARAAAETQIRFERGKDG